MREGQWMPLARNNSTLERGEQCDPIRVGCLCFIPWVYACVCVCYKMEFSGSVSGQVSWWSIDQRFYCKHTMRSLLGGYKLLSMRYFPQLALTGLFKGTMMQTLWLIGGRWMRKGVTVLKEREREDKVSAWTLLKLLSVSKPWPLGPLHNHSHTNTPPLALRMSSCSPNSLIARVLQSAVIYTWLLSS